MSLKKLTWAVIALFAAVFCYGTAHAGNIDAANKYAWGTNIGWLNFSPSHGGGVTVYDDHLEGYVWAENIGWIRLGTFTAGTAHTYANGASAADYGVNNNGSGTLSGYGWSTNAGWVNFSPTHGGVTIDSSGNSNGYAWGENVGWIHFQNASPAYKVVTTWTSTATSYTLTLNTAGTGTGTVGGGGNYTSGAAVALTATPTAGSVFAGWSPAPCAASFNMPGSALTCTATFNVSGVPPAGLPAAPTGLTATALSDTEILITWTDSSNNETGFIIERFDGIKWETAGTVGANVTSFTDTGLRYTWQYYYRVIAYNASGSSAPGGGASAWTWMFPYEDCDGVALNGAAWYSEVNLPENSPPGTVIGTFTTINPTGTHRYEFYPPIPIAGIDNDRFEIVGDTLRTAKNFTPDYETRQRYRISLRSIDVNANYAWCHAEFGIVITDVAEYTPPARSLRASVSIDTEAADGTAAPGDTLRLSADIINEGDTDVTGAVLTVPLPPGTEYAASAKRSESDVIYNAELNQIVWTGDIPAGQTAEIAFDLKVAGTAKTGDVIAPGEWSLVCDTDGDSVNDLTVKPEQDMTAASGVTVVVPDPECLPGDVNGDNDITLADAVTVLQILTGSETDAPALCADADGDGKTGFAELLVVLMQMSEP